MTANEIQPDQWSDFLRDFARKHETWLADVDTFRQPQGQPEQIAQDLHLSGIAVEGVDDARMIRLTLRRSAGENLVHEILRPSRVLLHQTGDGRDHELEIAGANAVTVVKFHSGVDAHIG